MYRPSTVWQMRRLSTSTLALVLTTSALTGAAQAAEAAAKPSKPRTVLVAPKSSLASSPSISKNGRYLAYQVGGATNDDNPDADPQVVLWDAKTRTKTIVSAGPGVPEGATGVDPSISPDGRFVAYVQASDFVPPSGGYGAAYSTTVLLWDRVTGTTTTVAPKSATADYSGPEVNAGGAFVTYEGWDPASDPDDMDGVTFLWQRSTGATSRVIVRPGAAITYPVGISDDGGSVLLGVRQYLESDADETVLWERRTHKTRSLGMERVPVMSGDGRYVALVLWRAGPTRGSLKEVPAVWDRRHGKVTKLRIPRRYDPLLKHGARVSAISDTGRYVTVLTYGKTVRTHQLLLVDRRTGTAVVASRTKSGALVKDVINSAVDKTATTIAFGDNAARVVGGPTPYGGALRVRFMRN
jgi:hypothetical protein